MTQCYVYILASKRNGTIYVGMTNDLRRRLHEHKHGLVGGFTKKYAVHRLDWYETNCTPGTAIAREKQIKKWKRAWKIRLIEESNPTWEDLGSQLVPWSRLAEGRWNPCPQAIPGRLAGASRGQPNSI